MPVFDDVPRVAESPALDSGRAHRGAGTQPNHRFRRAEALDEGGARSDAFRSLIGLAGQFLPFKTRPACKLTGGHTWHTHFRRFRMRSMRSNRTSMRRPWRFITGSITTPMSPT